MDPKTASDAEQFVNDVAYELESGIQQIWITIVFWALVWITASWYCLGWCRKRLTRTSQPRTSVTTRTIQQQREEAITRMEQQRKESTTLHPVRDHKQDQILKITGTENNSRVEISLKESSDYTSLKKIFKTKLSTIRIAESQTQESDVEIIGWIVRFVFKIICEGETISSAPASTTALFMSEQNDDYTEIPGLEELSNYEGSVGAVDFQEILLLLPHESFDYFMDCCSRIDHYGINSDLNLKNLLSPKRDSIISAIQNHLFPLMLEASDSEIETFLGKCTPISLSRLLVSNSSTDIHQSVVHCLVECIMIKGGANRNPSHINLLSTILGTSVKEWEWLANMFVAGETGLGFLSRCPDVADADVALRGLPKYPVVSESDTSAVLSAPRKNSEIVLQSLTKILTRLLKTPCKDGVISILSSIVTSASDRRKADFNAMPSLIGHDFAKERFLISIATSIFLLVMPVSVEKIDLEKLLDDNDGGNFSTEIFRQSLLAVHNVVIPSLRLLRKLREHYHRSLQSFVSQSGMSGQHINWEQISSQIPDPIKRLAVITDIHKASLLAPVVVEGITKFTLKIMNGGRPVSLPSSYLNNTLDWILYLCETNKEYLETSDLSPTRVLEWALAEANKPGQAHLFKARVLMLVNSMQGSRSDAGMTYGNAWDTSSLSMGHVSVVSLWHHVVSNKGILCQLPELVYDVFTGMKRASEYDITTDEHIYEGAKQHALSVFKNLILIDTFRDTVVGHLKSSDYLLVSEFSSSIITASIHSLDDSLLRLTEVNDLEKIMNNASDWNRMPQMQQQQHKQKLSQQRQSAAGFMKGAMGTLRVLQMLINPTNDTEQESIYPALENENFVKAASHFVVYFMNILYSKRCVELQTIHNPRDLNYDYFGILEVIVNLIVLLKANNEFKIAFLNHDDCDFSVLQKALDDVQRTALGGIRFKNGLNTFIDNLNRDEETVQRPESESIWLPPSDSILIDEEVFVETLEDFTNCVEDLGVDDGYKNHLYWREIGGSISASKKKALMRDKKIMQDLPLNPSASIFCITDETRFDLHRLVVGGAEGTPFAFGLFVFDIYCPETYPNCPPSCLIKTTGGGTIRMTPNLYEDGRVCLSLLNTWHGDDEGMKWNPGNSSIYQVALAIQSQVMVPDPYFGEPGAEKWINTKQGQKYSEDYNEPRRLVTLREAVLKNIISPPAGCSELFKTYFSLMSDKIMMQAYTWMEESSDEYRPKFVRVLEQLKDTFSKLEPSKCCTWV